MAIRDALLRQQYKRKRFDIDSEVLFVRSFSIAERDWWLWESRKIVMDSKGCPEELAAKALQKCLQDESGKPVFQPEDLARIKQLPVELGDNLYETVLRLSGLIDDKEDDAKKND